MADWRSNYEPHKDTSHDKIKLEEWRKEGFLNIEDNSSNINLKVFMLCVLAVVFLVLSYCLYK